PDGINESIFSPLKTPTCATGGTCRSPQNPDVRHPWHTLIRHFSLVLNQAVVLQLVLDDFVDTYGTFYNVLHRWRTSGFDKDLFSGKKYKAINLKLKIF
ncbi:hypothetical protein J6590_095052, partial [Homalodisca vitripennis]